MYEANLVFGGRGGDVKKKVAQNDVKKFWFWNFLNPMIFWGP